MHTRLIRSAIAVAALATVAPLGSVAAAGVSVSPAVSPAAHNGHPKGKVPAYWGYAFGSKVRIPALVLRLDHDVALRPWSYCLGGGCADGRPGMGGGLTDAGSADAVTFWFPEQNWTFVASYVSLDDESADAPWGTVTKLRDGNYRITAPDLTGRYRVDVYAHTKGHNSAAYSYLWTAPQQ